MRGRNKPFSPLSLPLVLVGNPRKGSVPALVLGGRLGSVPAPVSQQGAGGAAPAGGTACPPVPKAVLIGVGGGDAPHHRVQRRVLHEPEGVEVASKTGGTQALVDAVRTSDGSLQAAAYTVPRP